MFLDEIGKIVFNAEVRADEDRDRLNKAQAMYTAAQVSIQEFDPGFRLECERMAERERQRREQRRAEKEKERSRQASREGSANGNGSGSGQENGNGAPVRRSGRNNGQAPELGITDPLLIERRLKRQRPDGTTIASGEESGEDHSNENQSNNKRTRMDVDIVVEEQAIIPRQQDERDELDVLGPTSSQVRPTIVRFAPAPTLDDANSVLETPTRGSSINGHPHHPHHLHHHHSSQRPSAYLTPIAESAHSSEGRHNLALSEMLNPSTPTRERPLPSVQSLIASGGSMMDMSPQFQAHPSSQPQTPLPFTRLQQFDTLPTSPFVDTPASYAQKSDPATRFQPLMPIQSLPEAVSVMNSKEEEEEEEVMMDATGAGSSLLRTPRRSRSPLSAAVRQPVIEASTLSTATIAHSMPIDEKAPESVELAHAHTAEAAQAPRETMPTPMDIEGPQDPHRSPAPAAPPPSPPAPLPDFHVDEALLSALETRFVAQTEALNVEELEQLRATALNCIWRHRQAWDRDSCLRELVGIVDEFVEEACLEEGD